jgi:hypothetical protein
VRGKILLLFAAGLVGGPSLSQNKAAMDEAVPRITVSLPDNIPAEAVWLRSALYGRAGGRISRGERLTSEPNARHHEIAAVVGGTPAQEAKVVIFVPGCQFGVYDVDIERSDLAREFRCEPLPSKTVHGFLDPKKIPSNTYYAEKKLDITGYFTADWICDFFLQPRRSASNTEAGSCLNSGISLGTVGQLDPAEGGTFTITIPDFTRDPVFDKFGKNRIGVIQLALTEKNIPHTLATIKAGDATESGLDVRVEYRDPVVFTPVRH